MQIAGGALGGHFEKEQVRELLNVVAVGDAIVAEDMAVVPEALDDGGGIDRHTKHDVDEVLSKITPSARILTQE